MYDKLTFGELLDKLETDIFEKDSKDKFTSYCRKREDELKCAIDICGVMLHHHIEKPGLKGKIDFWKKEKIKDNIQNIWYYTFELNQKLNKESIEKNVKNQMSSILPIFINQEPDLVFLILHSYYGSILTDLNWIKDMPFQLTFGLASGYLNIEEIGKLLPKRIAQLKRFLDSENELVERYKSAFHSIGELLVCYEHKCYKSFNVLAIVTIESLVRQFGKYLIEKQGLEIDTESDRYNSIDSFLRKIPWKDRIKYSKTSAKLWTSNSFKLKEKEKNDLNSEEIDHSDLLGKGVFLNYKERLDFLRRRFKENRDMILHGQEMIFDTDWQCYINVSALLEVLKTMNEFTNLYEEK